MDDKNTNRTIEYYNTHADRYSEITRNADMSDIYKHFEEHLKPGAGFLILAAAVAVTANIFWTRDMMSYLWMRLKQCVRRHMSSREDRFEYAYRGHKLRKEFDAVWACASMLHVDKGVMIKIFAKVMKALKIGGVFYASWKYGKGEQTRDDGRTFANYTETKVCDMVYSVSGAALEDVWTSQDVRPDRTGQGHLWVNVLVKKTRVVITEKEFLNIFWKQYQIIEKDVRISSEYVDIHKSNFLDIFKQIHKYVPEYLQQYRLSDRDILQDSRGG